MQFNFQIDPRVGQWLNLLLFVISALMMASWWQDLLTAKEVTVVTGLMSLFSATVNYVLHGMPAPVAQAALSKAAKAAIALFAVLVLSLLFAAPGHAQTVTKAPPAPATPGYPYASDGFYFGVGTLGTGASSSVAGTDDTSFGAALTGIIGYQWRGGLDFVALENDVYYTNIGSATSCAAVPCAVNSEFGLEQRFKFGFPVSTLTALLPNLSSVFPALPTLPSSVVTTNSHPYLMVSLHEDDVSASLGLASAQAWQVQPGVGAGMLSQWTNGLAVDTWAEISFPGSGFDVISGKPSSANLGTEFRAGVSALY